MSVGHGLSPKQLRSLKESTGRINIWQGAVRSGKTYISLIRWLKELALGPEGEYCIVSRTYDSFKRNLLPLLVSMIGGDARYYSGKREMNIWGKTIHIIGADDERAETKLRGPTFMGAYVDEATIIPESVFKMLISRCAMKGARIFATTNPDSPYHWLKKDYLEGNPDVLSWQFYLDDNPELLSSEKEYLKRQYRGLWYKRFILGEWVQAEGAIYDFFEEDLHVINFPPGQADYYIVGVDYGTTNPCAAVLIGVSPNRFPNMWVEDEYYYDSKVHQRQKTDGEYAADLQRFLAHRNIRGIYLDPSAVSFRLELRKLGVENLYEAQNEVIDGIRLVAHYLNQGTLKVCRSCTHVISEIQSYVWDAKAAVMGKEQPLKTNDHAMDALRYAIYSHLFGKSSKTMSPQELDRIFMEAVAGPQGSLPAVFQQPNQGYQGPLHF
jgi:PBSX family phage terminase large subunit